MFMKILTNSVILQKCSLFLNFQALLFTFKLRVNKVLFLTNAKCEHLWQHTITKLQTQNEEHMRYETNQINNAFMTLISDQAVPHFLL